MLVHQFCGKSLTKTHKLSNFDSKSLILLWKILKLLEIFRSLKALAEVVQCLHHLMTNLKMLMLHLEEIRGSS